MGVRSPSRCAEGDTGYVYDGLLDFAVEETDMQAMPDIPVGIMMNVGTPDQAFAFSRLPNQGVGLARLEFIINRQIGIHPKALLDRDELTGSVRETRRRGSGAVRLPAETTSSSASPKVLATIAAAFAPKPVIVRMSDFKSQRVRRTSSAATSTSRTRRTR